MAIANKSKNKNSGSKKAKYKGNSAILEEFGRSFQKFWILTPDSDPSQNFRKGNKIQIVHKSSKYRIKKITNPRLNLSFRHFCRTESQILDQKPGILKIEF